MYIHSCIHRRSCMQRNVQICMHLPTHTHTPGPVQASGPSAHKSRARKTCPPLFSLLAHAYPCCHLQPHDYTKANLQISLPPPPPTTHTSKIWRALTDRPQPFISGLFPPAHPSVCLSLQQGKTNESQGSPLFFKRLGLGSWSWEDRYSETRHMGGYN